MRRPPCRSLAVAILLVLVSSAVLAGRQSQGRLVFRGGTDGVWVNVSVKQGRTPVANLTVDDFEVLDNGVRQHLQSLSVEAVPIDVTLAVDTSGSVVADLPAFKLELQEFAAMLRPVDRLRVVSFATGVYEVTPMHPATEPLDLNGLVAGGWTSSNDGLAYALLLPVADISRRHLVIALTDALDSHSTLDSTRFAEVAAHSEATLHVVLVPGLAPPTGKWEKSSREAVIAAAERSGGTVHELSRASGDFRRIFDDFRTSYMLQYLPENVPREGYHELKVRVLGPGAAKYTVRARRGYWGNR